MKIWIFTGLLVMALPVLAKTWKIVDSRGDVSFEGPEWDYLHDAFGLPHVLVSGEDRPRTSISFTVTGIKDTEFDTAQMAKDQEHYQRGRRDWARDNQAEIEEFFPYLASKNAHGYPVHFIGVRYRMKSQTFHELSYFVECRAPENLVHVKALTRDELGFVKPIMEDITKQLRCALASKVAPVKVQSAPPKSPTPSNP